MAIQLEVRGITTLELEIGHRKQHSCLDTLSNSNIATHIHSIVKQRIVANTLPIVDLQARV